MMTIGYCITKTFHYCLLGEETELGDFVSDLFSFVTESVFCLFAKLFNVFLSPSCFIFLFFCMKCYVCLHARSEVFVVGILYFFKFGLL